MKKSKIP